MWSRTVRPFVVSIVSVPVIALKIVMSQLNAQCVKTKVINYLIALTSFTVLMWTVVRKMIVLSRRRRKSKKEKEKKAKLEQARQLQQESEKKQARMQMASAKNRESRPVREKDKGKEQKDKEQRKVTKQ